jgi:hypothetical protein
MSPTPAPIAKPIPIQLAGLFCKGDFSSDIFLILPFWMRFPVPEGQAGQ